MARAPYCLSKPCLSFSLTLFFTVCLGSAIFSLSARAEGEAEKSETDAGLPIAQIYEGKSVADTANRIPLILSQTSSSRGWLCSGVFISKRRVLTARHCVEPEKNSRRKLIVKVFQGTTLVRARTTYRAVNDDVAIIVLPSQRNVVPVPVLVSAAPSVETPASAFGYGQDQDQKDGYERSLTSAGKLSLSLLNSALKKAAVGIEDIQADIAPGYRRSALFIFTANIGDGKPCQGDSGGPLILDLESGEQVVGGTLSFGEIPRNGPVCAAYGFSAFLSTASPRVKSFIMHRAPDAVFR